MRTSNTSEPSSRSTCPRSTRRPPSSQAWPAIGVRHDPSSSLRNARSADTAVDCGEDGQRPLVAQPRGQSDRGLADRRQEALDVERHAGAMGEAETVQPGDRQQRRVDRAAFSLTQSRLDAAAQQFDLQVRPQSARLRLATQRGGPKTRAMRQSRERIGEGRDQRVARVLADEKAAKNHSVGQKRRQVLGRVHGRVDPPFEKGGVDLLGEEALAASVRERAVQNEIARRADHAEFDRRLVPALRQGDEPARLLRLREGERGAAGAEREKNLGRHTAPIRKN